MKRVISLLAALTILIGASGITALAHGHHGSKAKSAAKTEKTYMLCVLDDCAEAGFHQHGNKQYCGSDEYKSYEVCSVYGCVKLGLHKHEDEYYRCDSVKGKYNKHHHR